MENNMKVDRARSHSQKYLSYFQTVHTVLALFLYIFIYAPPWSHLGQPSLQNTIPPSLYTQVDELEDWSRTIETFMLVLTS